MNLTRQANKLEHYLTHELSSKLPVVVLNNGDIVYKNFKIRQNKKTDTWELYLSKHTKIESFHLKACALIAANFYSMSALTKFNEIKLLDAQYKQNIIDAEIFKYRYNTTKDVEKRDIFQWRWEITSARAKAIKQQITIKFRSMF